MSRDRAMLGAPVHERIANDAYHTLDPRCIGHLDKVWPLKGRPFIEPMAGYGQLIWDIEGCGGILQYASDLYVYPDQDSRIVTGVNLFEPRHNWAEMANTMSIITNPPYSLLRPTVHHLLEVAPGAWLAILCRSSQLHVQAMQPMLTGGRLWGVAPLPFRPFWHHRSGEKSEGPRHEYAWFIWSPVWAISGPPRLLFVAPPSKPDPAYQSPLSPTGQWWRDLPKT
ncbi:MAG: hypothetical protein ABWY63_14355 [Hyphomicrobiaceae bacterium]